MSKISLTPNASGTGTFTIASPNSNTNRTLTLPDADGALLAGAQAPFIPAAVSGATQVLDVGAANFFDANTLTADTTVSFTNVPTEARWTYTAITSGLTTYDISSASPVKTFKGVFNQDTTPEGVFFKTDGTIMYMVGSSTDSVYQYTLSTAWDISTAVYASKSFDFTTQDTIPHDFFFKPDGTTMYMIGQLGDNVYEYSLSTAWDISTASYVRLFYVGAEETNPTGLFFKPDGTKMYITGTAGDAVDEYALSTAWNISTASHTALFPVSSQEANPQSVVFTPDGTKMFVVGVSNDAIFEYSLSTAWDVSTASYVTGFKVGLEESSPNGLFLKPDGTKMYVTGTDSDNITEYDVTSATSITLPASVQNLPKEAAVSDAKIAYTFVTTDGGTNVYLINEEVL